MTEEELKGIEEKWWNPFRLGDLPKNGLDDVSDLLAEVRRLNRMVDRAIDKLAEFGCVTDTDPCPANYVEVGCAECVRKYLESEAADNG